MNMLKTAFVFPGQGAQYKGMAEDFYQNIAESREIFDQASEVLGFDMKEICFQENEKLNQTEYTQAAMLTTCISILRAVENRGIQADITAGLSLGEYCSLTANGVFSFEDAVLLVRKRGILMEHEVQDGQGAMSAILGLENEKVEEICAKVQAECNKVVSPANYNCPGQLVISGDQEAVKIAGERLKEAGARRVLELKVSGPFHSELLKGAGEKLALELDQIDLREMKMPYISNVTAEIINENKNIKDLLAKQVYSPVRFQQSIELMIAEGVDTFIEIGPGKTLSGFIKKIDRTKQVINIDKLSDLDKLNDL